MPEHAQVPDAIVDELRAVCLGLAEAFEEPAWAGTRWRIRSRTFAHVVQIDAGWPPAYARAAGSDGPMTVVTFRAAPDELEAFERTGHPYFRPPWFDDIVGMVIDDRVDRDEVAGALTESYRLLAPKRLAARVGRASGV